MTLFVPVLIIAVLIDWYICRNIRRSSAARRRIWYAVASWSSVIFIASMAAVLLWSLVGKMSGDLKIPMWTMFAFFSVYIPKAVFVVFDLLAKIPQLFGRRKLILLSRFGLLGIAVFAVLWWGALVERYQLNVNEVEIARDDVPAGFDGFRIVQFSDIHVGSYGNDTAYIAKLVDRINSLDADIIVFTGDAVNRKSSELRPFVSPLSRLKAPYGVYSVMGNHDFGDYVRWSDNSEKIENLADMYQLQADMGWRMLNNNTDLLSVGTDTIALIGVENIGEPAMGSYGDLDAAYDGDLADDRFKILLSHNPYHWLEDIADAPDKNIALTLSGHTHAMQMRFFGWSPAKLRYRAWAGLYSDGSSLLYVNIGIGEIGIPARLGSATPEITIFTLRRK